MYKKICIALKALILLSLIYSCEKPEYIKNDVGFTEIKISVVGDIRIINPMTYDGKEYMTGELIPIDKNKDSVDISFFYNSTKPALKMKIENKIGPNNYFLYYNNPIDSTAIISKKHPIDGEMPPEGKSLMKIINLNKTLSPNDEPIHLAIYEYKTPWYEWVDPYVPIHDQIPKDTIFNITSSIPDNFTIISPLILGPMSHFAKVLKENKEELLVNGNKVYVFFNTVGNACILYLSNDKLEDQTDYNDYNFGPNPDNGYSLNALQFMYR